MTTWTKMKIENLVQFEWGNVLKTHVTAKTLFGSMTESVEGLREKVKNKNLLTPIRHIFQDMLMWAEDNK